MKQVHNMGDVTHGIQRLGSPFIRLVNMQAEVHVQCLVDDVDNVAICACEHHCSLVTCCVLCTAGLRGPRAMAIC